MRCAALIAAALLLAPPAAFAQTPTPETSTPETPTPETSASEAPAPGAAPSETASLSSAERDTLQRIERYLNELDTMKSRFLQLSSDGSQAEGTIYLDRPGGLRIEYDAPSPILIVADGRFLNYWDAELKQATYLKLDDTPAAVLVQQDLSFSDPKITVTGVDRARGAARVSVRRTERPHEGELTFVFETDPLRLRKWTVVDAQGVTTEVALLNPRFGVDLDKSLFQFSAPVDGNAPN